MYLQAILDVGTKPFYRLGVSIEHAPIKRFVFPPKDFDKWARICEHIIRHYNEGWANGHEWGIEYWEIWNEPEGGGGEHACMWGGTDEEYFRLYSVTANHLKKCFGDKIKVGGYAAIGFYAAFPDNPNPGRMKFIEFADNFFKYITAPETKAPLDFYSWHLYSGKIGEYEFSAKYARDLMEKYGFGDKESILDEWNWAGDDMFNKMRTEVGASLAAGVFSVMQHNAVDVGCYYDAQPAMHYCGIFSLETRKPTKTFYSFKAWNELYRLHNEAECCTDNACVKATAAVDGDKAGILVSCYEGDENVLRLNIKGFEGEHGVIVTIYAIDKDHFYEKAYCETFFGSEIAICRPCDKYTTYYVELKKG